MSSRPKKTSTNAPSRPFKPHPDDPNAGKKALRKFPYNKRYKFRLRGKRLSLARAKSRFEWSGPKPLSARYEAFVDCYLGHLLLAPCGFVGMPHEQRWSILTHSLYDAGWRCAHRWGKKGLVKQANYLLAHPDVKHSIQERVEKSFSRAGFNLDAACQVIASIAAGSEDVSASDKLKAVDMFVRLTIGYAPTTAMSINKMVHSKEPKDAFFDKQAFAETPPIDVTPRETL